MILNNSLFDVAFPLNFGGKRGLEKYRVPQWPNKQNNNNNNETDFKREKAFQRACKWNRR